MSDDILYEIQRSLGRIEQKIDSHISEFGKHGEEDTRRFEALFETTGKLKATQERQRGFLGGLTAAGTAVGAGIGYLIERMTLGHH
jgi:hypothetical protein